jgi:hypothetical protein
MNRRGMNRWGMNRRGINPPATKQRPMNGAGRPDASAPFMGRLLASPATSSPGGGRRLESVTTLAYIPLDRVRPKFEETRRLSPGARARSVPGMVKRPVTVTYLPPFLDAPRSVSKFAETRGLSPGARARSAPGMVKRPVTVTFSPPFWTHPARSPNLRGDKSCDILNSHWGD